MPGAVTLNGPFVLELRISFDISSLQQALLALRAAFVGEEIAQPFTPRAVVHAVLPPASRAAAPDATAPDTRSRAPSPPAGLAPQPRRGRKSNAQKAAEAAVAAAAQSSEPQYHLTKPLITAPVTVPGLTSPKVTAEQEQAFKLWVIETFIPQAGHEAYTDTRAKLGNPIAADCTVEQLAAWRAACEAVLAAKSAKT